MSSPPPQEEHYDILTPSIYNPRLSPHQLSHLRPLHTHTLTSTAHTIALSARFDPPANPWLYHHRPTSPSPPPQDDSEVLTLDADILERNLSTGVIGDCGRSGCRVALGCVECAGRLPPVDPTPRTSFRAAVAAAMGAAAVAAAVEADDQYPTRLQRMEVPAARGRKRNGGGVGPRIKYCRKRPVVEDVEEEEEEAEFVVSKPHRSRAQLAAVERRRRVMRKKG